MFRALVRTGVHNPVLLNLLFAVVCLAGILAYRAMPKEEFPRIVTDRVAITVVYPGASPADVEDLVVRPIEDAVDGTEGLKHLYADALEGRMFMTMEFVRGTDVDGARDEVIRQVESVDDLPDDILGPYVNVASVNQPILHVALTGDTRAVDLAERFADDLLAFPGVSQVRIEGADERQIHVDLDAARVAALGIAPAEVAEAIRRARVGAPAGSVSLADQGVLVRTARGVSTPDDLAGVPLRVDTGQQVTVGDVATVREVWERPSIRTRIDGQPCIDLQPLRLDEGDALKLVPDMQAWADAARAELPPGLDLVVYDDTARLVSDRLGVLARNGLAGIGLVALTLVLFIGLRNAALVVWGMPVAYLGAVAAMYAAGTTISVVSTFGLLLVTGIIVDDAVVIVENVQRHLEMGKDRVRAAIEGTSEVAGAVMAATLTTCLAFAPLLMLEGTVGRIMSIIPTVVILSLVASLFEAFVVLPGHLGHHAEEPDGAGERENLPTRTLKRAYTPILRAVTAPRWRWPVLAALGVVVAGAIGLSTLMRTSLTTEGNPVFAFVDVDLAPSADAEATTRVIRDLERFTFDRAGDVVIYAAGRVGEQKNTQGLPTWGARHGQIKIGFQNTPDALAKVPPFLDEVRAFLADRPDVVEHGIMTLTGGPPAGKDIDVRVRGRDEGAVDRAVGALADWMEARPAITDVRAESGEGSDAWEVRVDPARAARFGVAEDVVTQAVRTSLDGLVAVEMPVMERTTEVRVALPEPRGRAAVEDTPIVLPGVGSLRVRQVADVVRTSGVGRLSRVDGERSVRLSAEVDDALSSPTEERSALDAAFSDLDARFPGATLFYGGQLADTEESFAQLPRAALMAIVLIYFVLAVQFRSYWQPLIILSAVPLGVAGVVLGLFSLRMDLSLIAMIGAVGLVGIVVNDSLVLVDFINRARDDGRAVREAVVEASLVRLRPILITTVTTVLGLLPMALGLAGEDPLLAPMAVSISFGLAFATGLTLVVVPVLYLVLHDAVLALTRLTTRATAVVDPS